MGDYLLTVPMWEGPPGRDINQDQIPINILVVIPIDIATRWCVALGQSPVGRLYVHIDPAYSFLFLNVGGATWPRCYKRTKFRLIFW